MVVHRTCSFCAGEIEPGTGQLFVKRDGSLFSFCSSSCRKQQMGLGRVGHRLRWTRAHELKRQAEQRRQPAATEPPASETPRAEGGKKKAGSRSRASTASAKKAPTATGAGVDTPGKEEGTDVTPKKVRAKKTSPSTASS